MASFYLILFCFSRVNKEDIVNGNEEESVTINLTDRRRHCVEQRQARVLDGKEKVWSVAFGSGSTKEDNELIWRHFKVDKGLLLATGHQNGNIKVWDCSSGIQFLSPAFL